MRKQKSCASSSRRAEKIASCREWIHFFCPLRSRIRTFFAKPTCMEDGVVYCERQKQGKYTNTIKAHGPSAHSSMSAEPSPMPSNRETKSLFFLSCGILCAVKECDCELK